MPGCAPPSRTWLSIRPDDAPPVVVMVHGFMFDPAAAASDASPFELVYGRPGVAGGPGTVADARLSWLPLVGECDESGGEPAEVAVAFAWDSTGSIARCNRAGWSGTYQFATLDLAPLAAASLATALDALGAAGAAVRVLAHSLGTRTFSQAVGLLKAAGRPARLERAVLLGGAEFCVDAAANFAACGFDVVNLASGLDQALALGGEAACAPYRWNGSQAARVIGRQGVGPAPRWLDLRLDDPALVAWGAQGRAPSQTPYAIDARAENDAHPTGELGHWSYYTNPGNRAFVRHLLLHGRMTVDALRQAGVPEAAPAGTYQGAAIPETPMTLALRQHFSFQVAGDQPRGGRA